MKVVFLRCGKEDDREFIVFDKPEIKGYDVLEKLLTRFQLTERQEISELLVCHGLRNSTLISDYAKIDRDVIEIKFAKQTILAFKSEGNFKKFNRAFPSSYTFKKQRTTFVGIF